MSHTVPESESAPALPVHLPAQTLAPVHSQNVLAQAGQHAPGALAVRGKVRGPVAVWLLSCVTFGIYGLVWYYKINRELRDFHASIQVKPGLAVLAMFVPIAGWVSIYNTGQRIGQAQQLAGLGSQCSGVLGLVASWFFGLHAIYFQGQLNRVWNGR
jgi:ABC-type proline/glycine betaine transport system permease subunit